MNPKLLAWFVAASPRLVWEFANAVGVTVKTLKKGMANAKRIVVESGKFLDANKLDDLPFDLSTAIDSIRSGATLDPTESE